MKKAFTLIELLVSCAIIAIIATLVLLSYTEAQKKSRDSRRKADLESISQAILMYQSKEGRLPFSQNGFWAGVAKLTPDGSTGRTLEEEIGDFLPSIPVGPKTGEAPYYYLVDNNKYALFSSLENDKDKEYSKCQIPSAAPYSGKEYHYVAPKYARTSSIYCFEIPVI